MGRLEQKSVLIIDLVKKEKFLPSQPEARDNYTTRFRQLIYYISNEKAHVPSVDVYKRQGPMLAEIKIRQVSTSIAMCPASILAKRRIIKANGFVKIPKNSMKGIIGTGTFSHQGTSGQKISFQ